MNLLLLGGGGPAGINWARAAYECGHQTLAVDVDPVSLQLARGRWKELVEADRDPEVINDLCERYDCEIVHAQPDPEVQWLARHQHAIRAKTLLPDRAALFIAADKLRTAEAVGSDAPVSVGVNENSDLAELIERLGGDCWLRLRTGAGSSGALPVDDAGIAEAWLRHHDRLGIARDEWMLSERLPGRDLSFTGVYKDGELVACGMKERLRLHGASRSPARIASTANLQVTIDSVDLRALAARVVDALPGEPNGVLMFDVREDRFGVPKLTEINAGRFGTTSLHWHVAGRNLVADYISACAGRELREPGACESGVAWAREMDSPSMRVTL